MAILLRVVMLAPSEEPDGKIYCGWCAEKEKAGTQKRKPPLQMRTSPVT